MKVIHLASAKSAWKGYEYYSTGSVLSREQIGDGIYRGKVKGSDDTVYDVTVNVDHPRSSKCNCPHAAGTTKICKHIVALYFSFFPDDAAEYKKEAINPFTIEEYYSNHYYDYDDYDDYGIERTDLPDEIVSYINKASRNQLQKDLRFLLQHIDDELLDYFIDECDIDILDE